MGAFEQLVLPLFDWLQPGQTSKPAASSNNRRRVFIDAHHEPIDYWLKRSKRKSIGFLIDDNGLTVSAPRWVSVTELDHSVREKSAWIQRKLMEWREHQRKREAMRPEWKDGGKVKYLGAELRIRVKPDTVGVVKQGQELWLGLPAGVNTERIKDLAQSWLLGEAKRLFGERLEELAMRAGKAPRSWSLSSARTRWGSCTADHRIRLNWRLIHFRLEVIDYVIAHELAHLVEMNHGPKFWDQVAQMVPDYAAVKSELTGITDDM